MDKRIFAVLLIGLFSCGSDNSESIASTDVVEEIDSVMTDSIVTDSVEIVEWIEEKHDCFAFGYANEKGDKLLLLGDEDEDRLEEFSKVLDADGNWLDISFQGMQAETEENNHRQNVYNFENAAGPLFSVENGVVDEWNTAFVVTDDFFENHEVLKSHPVKFTTLKENDRKLIEQNRDRKIIRSETVNAYDNGILYFIEFEVENDSALVSLCWMDNDNKLSYKDFPALSNEISTWSVDDGGIFEFEYYQILAMIQGPNGIELFVDWVGAEGNSINYLILKEGEFESVKGGYRYMAPL